jgi:hypothetical protein
VCPTPTNIGEVQARSEEFKSKKKQSLTLEHTLDRVLRVLILLCV